ncbi:tautomerase family protein [Bradyrhizobium sp. CB1650]|uniref:tautomerase family protein n=1 Tax=Bradyrhizobium sp. CB1650 TaxID=3039153 RepID=UPI002435CE14|nr:tautomerase family protein [Bradyrhizobium sp. CB1650]WGD53168.1 tautomerase family protein [Bradyrhizobium sp. CB1650]
MPLWHIYCPKEAYSDTEKQDLATRISDAYAKFGLPRFYVSVIFHDVEQGSFYIGGEPVKDFVRIWVDHIARRMEPAHRGWWMKQVKEIVTPFIGSKSFRWEAHVDDTPIEFWSIQGLKPPPEGSDAEKKWFAENKASAY